MNKFLVGISLLFLTNCSSHKLLDDGIIGEGIKGKSASSINEMVNNGELDSVLNRGLSNISYSSSDPRKEGWFIYIHPSIDKSENYKEAKIIEGGIYAK